MKRVCVVASASGSGKTTLGRALAARLRVPFHELDALNHGPGWIEASPAELRARVEPLVTTDEWVIDGAYRGKLGNLVLARADTVVWLDLPRRVWLPRLLRRTARRLLTRQALWNGNRETLRGVLWAPDALIPIAWRLATPPLSHRAGPVPGRPTAQPSGRGPLPGHGRARCGQLIGRHQTTRASTGTDTSSPGP
jgi:hypothetical protein